MRQSGLEWGDVHFVVEVDEGGGDSEGDDGREGNEGEGDGVDQLDLGGAIRVLRPSRLEGDGRDEGGE